MKIITWNCQMAFRKKCEEVLNFQPDLLIIPECENEAKLQFGKLTPKPNDFFWYGDNPHKGIGIFSYSDFKFQLSPLFNPAFRYVIPLKVSGRKEFNLIAIWAMPNKKKHKQRYIGQVWSALQYYKKMLAEDTIIIGDFNGNQIWDKNSYTGNFTETLHFLEELDFKSLYHLAYKEQYGKWYKLLKSNSSRKWRLGVDLKKTRCKPEECPDRPYFVRSADILHHFLLCVRVPANQCRAPTSAFQDVPLFCVPHLARYRRDCSRESLKVQQELEQQ